MSFSQFNHIDPIDFSLQILIGAIWDTSRAALGGSIQYGIAYLAGITAVTSAISCASVAAAFAVGTAVVFLPNVLLQTAVIAFDFFPAVVLPLINYAMGIAAIFAGAAILSLPLQPLAICAAIGVAIGVLIGAINAVIGLATGDNDLCQNDRTSYGKESCNTAPTFFQSEQAPKMNVDASDDETCDTDSRFTSSSAFAAA